MNLYTLTAFPISVINTRKQSIGTSYMQWHSYVCICTSIDMSWAYIMMIRTYGRPCACVYFIRYECHTHKNQNRYEVQIYNAHIWMSIYNFKGLYIYTLYIHMYIVCVYTQKMLQRTHTCSATDKGSHWRSLSKATYIL